MRKPIREGQPKLILSRLKRDAGRFPRKLDISLHLFWQPAIISQSSYYIYYNGIHIALFLFPVINFASLLFGNRGGSRTRYLSVMSAATFRLSSLWQWHIRQSSPSLYEAGRTDRPVNRVSGAGLTAFRTKHYFSLCGFQPRFRKIPYT
jgi:hypothetical protein